MNKKNYRCLFCKLPINLKNGIKFHNSYVHYECRVFKYNENFFNEINTEEKAYWLGFLYADGCLHCGTRKEMYKKQYFANIGLSSSIKDEEHLQKFSNIFNRQLNKRINGGHSVCYVSLHNENICYALYLLKLHDRDLKFIKNLLSEDMLRHFVRGFFDGDGSVALNGKKGTNIQLQVHFACYSYEFARDLEEIIVDKVGLKRTTIYKVNHANCWYVHHGGNNNLQRFYIWLYNGSSIFLKRKKQIFDFYLANKGSH